MEWDEPDAFRPTKDAEIVEPPTRKSSTQPTKRTEKTTQAEESETKWKKNQRQLSPAEPSQSSDDGSGDEYVDDGVAAAGTKRKPKVRRTILTSASPHWFMERYSPQHTPGINSRRIITMSSESDDDSGDGDVSERDGKVRRHRPGAATTAKVKASMSPQPSGALKRKQSISAAGAGAGPGKRKRAESLSAAEDATRKYCLGKLTEMFSGIFLRYPHVQKKSEAQEGEGEGEEPREIEFVERKAEELSEEEKTQTKERATTFTAEVEQAIFNTYAEPDKYGKLGAGAKYKCVLSSICFNTCSYPLQGALPHTHVQPTTVRSRTTTPAYRIHAGGARDPRDDVVDRAGIAGATAVDQAGGAGGPRALDPHQVDRSAGQDHAQGPPGY